MTQPTSAAANDLPPLAAVADLLEIAGSLPPKSVVIPGGDRDDDLRLVESARDHGIVDRCVLIGDGPEIRAAAGRVGIDVSDADIIATSCPEDTASRTMDIVRAGEADIILKGNISTPILNRAMLGIATRPTISLVTMFDATPIAGGRPMLLTDPGVTTSCTFERMVCLVENAVEVAQAIMGIDRPRVAILSANEKIIKSLPSTAQFSLSHACWLLTYPLVALAVVLVLAAAALVYGPLSFDMAVSAESVRLKDVEFEGVAAEVAGKADILVCPGLDSANILYKVIMEIVKYGLGTFAGVTMGVMTPYVILSRADNVATKLLSIALSSIAKQRMQWGTPGPAAADPLAVRARPRRGARSRRHALPAAPGRHQSEARVTWQTTRTRNIG